MIQDQEEIEKMADFATSIMSARGDEKARKSRPASAPPSKAKVGDDSDDNDSPPASQEMF